MITIRHAHDRGHTDHGWLNSWHSFSFAGYHDPAHMGYSVLRVINDDRIAQGGGFASHPHRDMEIVTYLLNGALQHKDSLGNGSVIRPGDVQRMSAGSGVVHSESNAADGETHLLQIWLLPEKVGGASGYEQKHFDEDALRDTLRLVASRNGRNGSVRIQQDASIYATRLRESGTVKYQPASSRHLYLHVARGALEVNGTILSDGDGAAIEDEAEVTFIGRQQAEALLFDLP